MLLLMGAQMIMISKPLECKEKDDVSFNCKEGDIIYIMSFHRYKMAIIWP